MKSIIEINFLEIEEKEEYKEVLTKVATQCFTEERLLDTNLYISVTLTNPDNIRRINKEYRNIDKETDVLSFPMFGKEELKQLVAKKEYLVEDVLGDIMISIPRVEEQAKEYGHSFQRELSYMLVHGFYHLMGYDHIEEQDKIKMRPKEEKILEDLNITRI